MDELIFALTSGAISNTFSILKGLLGLNRDILFPIYHNSNLPYTLQLNNRLLTPKRFAKFKV